MAERPVLSWRYLSAPFGGALRQNVSLIRPAAPAAEAVLPLAPLLSLTRDLAALFAPVRPRAEFRAALQRDLLAAARQQAARERLITTDSAAAPGGEGRRWLWGAATVGSAMSLMGIAALVWRQRHRQAA